MDRKWPFARSIRVYRALVRLYPARFRDEFGPEMEAAFERLLEERSASEQSRAPARAWRIVLVELGPTLLREHAAAAGEAVDAGWHSPRLRTILRFGLAALLPVASYLILLGWVMSLREGLTVTMFFAMICGGMLITRGRGTACLLGAVLGAMCAVELFAVVAGLTQVTHPNIILISPLLAATAGTVALILATYVRLVIEGISLRAA
jgi:hypothetical protein